MRIILSQIFYLNRPLMLRCGEFRLEVDISEVVTWWGSSAGEELRGGRVGGSVL